VSRALTNKDANSVYLRVAITEPILLTCIDGASLHEICLSVQKSTPATELAIKNYLYHLVNNILVSYKGIMKMFFITPRGLDMLEIIYYQRRRTDMDFSALTIKLE
jgi:hypothetical protein